MIRGDGMSAVKPSKKCLASYVFVVLTVLFIIVFIKLYRSISSHLTELCRYRCSEVINRMLTEAVDEAGQGITLYNSGKLDGRPVSLSANSVEINRMNNKIRQILNEKLAKDGYETITLTLGDLTDFAYFSGKGPEITVSFQQTGVVDTKLDSDFSSAGINQTRFRASIIVLAEFIAILPTGTENITVTEEVLLCDEIIVGEIPNFYSDSNPKA